MKFKVEEDDVTDGAFCTIYDSKEEFLKNYCTGPALQEFLDRDEMDSLTVNFGDYWYRFSRVYDE